MWLTGPDKLLVMLLWNPALISPYSCFNHSGGRASTDALFIMLQCRAFIPSLFIMECMNSGQVCGSTIVFEVHEYLEFLTTEMLGSYPECERFVNNDRLGFKAGVHIYGKMETSCSDIKPFRPLSSINCQNCKCYAVGNAVYIPTLSMTNIHVCKWTP